MTPPKMPTRPKRPTRATAPDAPPAGSRERNRQAFRMGAAARFATGDNGELPADAAAAALAQVDDDLDRMADTAGLDDDEREQLHRAAAKGFTSAAVPLDALPQAFASIRTHEAQGLLLNTPAMLLRGNPAVYPRLFAAAVMISCTTDNAGGWQRNPFAFACNAVAAAYTDAFGAAERIHPYTVGRFLERAAMFQQLEIVRKGTPGRHGQPSVYRLTDGWRVEWCGLPADMMLRQQWAMQWTEAQCCMV